MASPQLCVFCRKHPAEHEWRPFCSERCKMLDLARWADGSYRVPGERAPQPQDENKAGDGKPRQKLTTAC